jgi:histidine triad (HIT) family protein
MTLTQEQITELKSQLLQQVKTLPEDQRKEAEKQIHDMSAESLESMLKQQQSKSSGKEKGVYRMIIDKEIPSKLLDENKSSIAVLEIKPISPGHIIIIPKKAVKAVKELSSSSLTLAKKLASRLTKKMKAKSAEIQTEFKFGEMIVNVIPIYDKSLNINSPRTDVKEAELEKIYSILRVIKKPKIAKIKKELPKTIPGNQVIKWRAPQP